MRQLKQVNVVFSTYQLLQQMDGKRHTWTAFPRLDVVRIESRPTYVSNTPWALTPKRTSNALAKAANRIAKKSKAPRL